MFLRKYGAALSQLATEGLIKQKRATAFTYWLDVHEEDVQTDDFWEDLWSCLEDLL